MELKARLNSAVLLALYILVRHGRDRCNSPLLYYTVDRKWPVLIDSAQPPFIADICTLSDFGLRPPSG